LSGECAVIKRIQQKIIRDFQVPVRGAMTIGKIFIENGIVFGPALVRAVELEKTATKRMPIIILDHCVTSLLTLKNFSENDISYDDTVLGLPVYFADYFDTQWAVSCKDILCGKGDELLSLENRRVYRFSRNTNNSFLTP